MMGWTELDACPNEAGLHVSSGGATSSACEAGALGFTLPLDILTEHLLPKIEGSAGRKVSSLVCKLFLSHERRTRTSLRAKCSIRQLLEFPRCWPAITDLNLCACSYLGSSLGRSGVVLDEVLKSVFPNVRKVEVTGLDRETSAVIGGAWPRLQIIEVLGTVYQAAAWTNLFDACRELEVVGFTPADDDIYGLPPPEESEAPHINWPPSLTKVEGICVVDNDSAVKHLTESCTNLESLSCHLLKNSTGHFTQQSLQYVADHCPKLRTLRLPVDNGSMGFSDEVLVKLGTKCPSLGDWALWGNGKVSGGQVAQVCEKATTLKCLELEDMVRPTLGPQDGLAFCRNLKDLKIWTCADLTDEGLTHIAIGCPNLELIELYKCHKVGPVGLKILCGTAMKLTAILYDMAGMANFMSIFHVVHALAPGPGKAALEDVQLIYDTPRAGHLSIGEVRNIDELSEFPKLKSISVWTGSSAGTAQLRLLLDVWLPKCPNLDSLVISTELAEEASTIMAGAVSRASTVTSLDLSMDPMALYLYFTNCSFLLNNLVDLKIGTKFTKLGLTDGLYRLFKALSRLPKLERLRLRSCDDFEVPLQNDHLQLLLESKSLREAYFYWFMVGDTEQQNFYGELLSRD